jgi:glycogen operon protein
MLSHGDELGRTQKGNNNGYCQDNELTWIDWERADTDLIAFTRAVSALRRDHPTFRRRRFFDGLPVRRKGEAPLPDIAWLQPDGNEMTDEDWESGFGKSIAVFLNGEGIRGTDERGDPVRDDSFLLCFSAYEKPIDFHIPGHAKVAWTVVLDTAMAAVETEQAVAGGSTVKVEPRTMVVLQRMS